MIYLPYTILFIINLYVFSEGYNRIHESLWHDEAWVAISILKPNIFEMINYSDPVQSTPLGYLLVVRFLIQIFGDFDWVFRIFSLFVGIVNINLLFLITYKILKNSFFSIIPIIIFVTNYTLLRYNAELKQYSLEILCSLSTILILDLLEDKFKNKKIIFFISGLLYSVFLFFSSSTILVLAILLLCGFLKEKTIEDKIKYLKLYIPFIIPVGVIFILYYVLYLSIISKSSMLHTFWAFGFPERNQPGLWITFLKERMHYFIDYLLFNSGKNFIYLFTISFFAFFVISRTRLGIFLFLAPILLFLISLLRLFPFAIDSRMYLFYHCLLFIPIGFLIQKLLSEWIEKIYIIFEPFIKNLYFKKYILYFMKLITLLFFLYSYFFYTKGQIESKEYIYNYEPMKEYYSILSKNISNNDVVYLYYNSKYSFNYYNRKQGLNIFPTGWYEQHKNVSLLIEKQTEVLKEAAGRNLWLLATRPHPDFERMKWEDELLEENAKKYCEVLDRIELQRGKVKNGVLIKFHCKEIK